MSEEMLNEAGSDQVSSNTEQANTSTEVNFKELISEDLRNDPSLQDFKDVDALAKSYVSAQRMLGNSVRVPGEDAGEEALKAFYEKLESVPGVVRIPEDAEGRDQLYAKLGRPENPENYDLGDVQMEGADTFKKMAHEAGLTGDQAQKLFEAYNNNIVAPQLQEFEAAKEAGMATLKDKWGADYDARMNGAKAVIAKYSELHPDAVNQLVNGPMGNNPALIQILSDAAQAMDESEVVNGMSKAQYGMTREEALDKIQEIRDNSAHPFHVQTDPGHSAAVHKMQKLYNVAFPGE